MAISPSGRLKTQTKRQNKFQCLSCKSSPSAGRNAAVPPRWQAYATACRAPCPCRTPFWTANTAATANKESCSEDGTTVFLAGRPKCKIWQALPVKLNGGFEFTRQADRIDIYSELNLNQYSVGSPCRTICTVCGSPPCPDFC